MRMKNPEDDVPLTNGEGFTVQMEDYEEHLKQAKEIPQVCEHANALMASYSCLCRKLSAIIIGQ